MPTTDHLALCPPEARAEFDRWFSFGLNQGVVTEQARSYYAGRFVVDANSVREEIKSLIVGQVAHASNTHTSLDPDLTGLAGYPGDSEPSSDVEYPTHWLRTNEQPDSFKGRSRVTFG